jgi:hypothetical protein
MTSKITSFFLVPFNFFNTFINLSCDNDRIVFYDSLNLTTAYYCGQQSAVFAIETCMSTLTINVATRGTADPGLKGVLIYYEAIPKPQNFICSAFTIPASTTSPTTPKTTTASTPSTSTRPLNYGQLTPS